MKMKTNGAKTVTKVKKSYPSRYTENLAPKEKIVSKYKKPTYPSRYSK